MSRAVCVTDVSVAYGQGATRVLALDSISFGLEEGEIVCVVGASGCGKSTLLSLIARLRQPNSGSIELGQHRVALMFQEPALFPWLTALGNVETPMRVRGVSRRRRRERARELLDVVRLSEFENHRPHQLSGGMRQRIALARALAQEADVLLMDEPFGALDAITRDLLHDELERIWIERNLSIVFVTHNVSEAVRLGDRVILLRSRPGRVLEEFPVHHARPRRVGSPGLGELASLVTDRLRDEVSKNA